MRCWICGESASTLFRVVVGLDAVEYLVCTDCANKRRWRNVRQS